MVDVLRPCYGRSHRDGHRGCHWVHSVLRSEAWYPGSSVECASWLDWLCSGHSDSVAGKCYQSQCRHDDRDRGISRDPSHFSRTISLQKESRDQIRTIAFRALVSGHIPRIPFIRHWLTPSATVLSQSPHTKY